MSNVSSNPTPTLPDRPVALRQGSLAVGYASSLLEHLKLTIRREAQYPSRPEMHRRLTDIVDAARLLMRELTDVPMSVLLNDGYEGIESLVILAAELRDLVNRAATVRRRSPRKQGRGRLLPDPHAGPDALGYCALIVSIAWYKEKSDWPGQRNAKAHMLCEALWLAAEGAPHGQLGARPGTLTAWREHLVAARKYRPPHAAGVLVAETMAELALVA